MLDLKTINFIIIKFDKNQFKNNEKFEHNEVKYYII